jgi:hypothetical protein
MDGNFGHSTLAAFLVQCGGVLAKQFIALLSK